jgi:4-hydroxybenzoate polyprenyltransferase
MKLTPSQTLKKLFWIARPISWPNTAYPFAAGFIIAGLTAGPLGATAWLTLIVGTIYFLGPYNLLMYGVNDVYDYESDIKNPRKGGIEGMKESRSFHPIILKASILINAPFLLYLLVISSWPARAVLVFVVFMVVAYSLKGLRFKEKPVLDSITSSMHFVGPLLYALSLWGFPTAAWPFVVAFFLWGMASHAFGAIQDIIPDKKAGIASIATVFGARATVWACLVLYASAALLVASQGAHYWAIWAAGLCYVLNIFPYQHVTEATSATTNKGWKRFIWLNYLSGAVVTMVIIATNVAV